MDPELLSEGLHRRSVAILLDQAFHLVGRKPSTTDTQAVLG
jgi:hypothetical protein